MKSPSQKTVKRLFAASGNRCAFPDCYAPLIEQSGTVTGEIAHIKASSKAGPRFDPEQTNEERHSFGNLMLLCSRHHTVIDSEADKYPVEVLMEMKRTHETVGVVEIGPRDAVIAQSLIQKYENVVIVSSGGNVAVGSPGAIQAGTVNVKTSKKQIRFAPPAGSVGNNPEMCSYIEYLIGKYQDLQKQDKEKEGKYKYIAIYTGIKREFGSKWQVLPEAKFGELCNYLYRRIDSTKVGRIRKKRGQKTYHTFEEHGVANGA